MIFQIITFIILINCHYSQQCSGEQASQPCTSCQCVKYGTNNYVEREVWPGQWGGWQGRQTASSPYSACGASMQVEPNQGVGLDNGKDDTSWNGLRLKYCNINNWNDQTEQYIYTGRYGGWDSYTMCPHGQFIRGAQIRYEDNQGDGDDTAGNGLRIKCENNWVTVNGGHWGNWQHQVSGNGNQGVCGAEIKYEVVDNSADETGVNGLRILFCEPYCQTGQCTGCIYGYVLINNVCEVCKPQCETCQNSTDQCILCSGGENRMDNPPQCSCFDGFYANGFDNNCPACSFRCNTCISNDLNCTECKPGLQRTLTTPSCGCNDGWFEETDNIDCQICDVQCLTCVNNDQNCLICKQGDNRTMQTPHCLCQDGYFEFNQQLDCFKCHYRCLTCEKTERKCLTCDASKFRAAPPNCYCQDGYYEDIADNLCKQCHPACKTCSSYDYCLTCEPGNHRNLVAPGCGCLNGFFSVNNNFQCEQCDFRCDTCETTKENCTKCKQGIGRTLVPSTCLCDHGFYDDGVNIDCQECQYPCFTCENAATECIVCGYGDNRYDAPNCGCKTGFSEINNTCEDKCSQLCEECDELKRDACTICNENFPFFLEKNGFLACYAQCPTGYSPNFSNKNGNGNIPCQCSNGNGVCTSPPEPVTEQIQGQGLGYMKQLDGSVTKCLQQGCRNCDGDKTRCKDCMKGYFKNNQNICERCHFSCSSCYGPSHNECYICSSIAWNEIGHGIAYEYREGHCDRVFKQPLEYKCPDQEDDSETYDGPVCGLTDSEVQVIERELNDEIKFKMNDSQWKDIKLSGSECQDRSKVRNKLFIDDSFDLIQSTVETRGQELLNLAVILNLAEDVADYKGDPYNPESLMQFFNSNQDNIYTLYEYNPFEDNEIVYCYSKLQRKSLAFEDFHVGYNKLIDLKSGTQKSDMKYTECYNTDDTFVEQAQEAFKPIKKNIFLLVNICTSEGKAVEGVFLRQDENSNYIFYNVRTGQEEIFTLLPIDSSSLNNNRLMKITTVNVQKVKSDATTIQDVINGNVYDEGADKCDLSVIQPLIDQIMMYTKRENCDELSYMDIRPGAKGYIDNPYMQKTAYEKLQKAVDRELDVKERRIQVQSGMSTFVEEYIKYQWYKNECQCNITSVPEVSESLKAEGLEIDVGFFYAEFDSWGKTYKTSMAMHDFTWGEHCSPTSYTYNKPDTAPILQSQITIFQKLWNCQNYNDQIEVTGEFNDETESRLLSMEITGFEARNYTGFLNTINCWEDQGLNRKFLKEEDCPNLDPISPEYSHQNGLKYLNYVKISYCPPEQVKQWTCPSCSKQPNVKEVHNFSSKDFKSYISYLWPKAQDTININSFVAYDEDQKEIVISISGKIPTNSTTEENKVLREYLLNINKNQVNYGYCPDCKISKELYEGLKVVKYYLFEAYHELKEEHVDATLSITGHGIGGGIATLFALFLKENQNIYVDQLYIFGAPRIGNKQFVQFVQDSLPEYYQIVNADDGVSHLPVSGGSARFRRLQSEIWYEDPESNSFQYCEIDEEGNESAECSNKINKLNFYESHYQYLGEFVGCDDSKKYKEENMDQIHQRYDSKKLNQQD